MACRYHVIRTWLWKIVTIQFLMVATIDCAHRINGTLEEDPEASKVFWKQLLAESGDIKLQLTPGLQLRPDKLVSEKDSLQKQPALGSASTDPPSPRPPGLPVDNPPGNHLDPVDPKRPMGTGRKRVSWGFKSVDHLKQRDDVSSLRRNDAEENNNKLLPSVVQDSGYRALGVDQKINKSIAPSLNSAQSENPYALGAGTQGSSPKEPSSSLADDPQDILASPEPDPTGLATTRRGTVAIPPNGIRGKPHLFCNADGITFTAETWFQFVGVIFARPHQNDDRCSQAFLSPTLFVNITFNYVICGTPLSTDHRTQETIYGIEIVMLYQTPGQSEFVQTYLAQCMYQRLLYDQNEIPTQIEEAIEELRIVPIQLEQRGKMPQCLMRVVPESESDTHSYGPSEKQPVKVVNIGDQLKIEWSLNPPSEAFGFLISNCTVRDQLTGRQFEVIDSKGCSTDLNILAHPHYDTYSDLAILHWHAFKVPDNTILSFVCNCRVCNDITDENGKSGCSDIPTPPYCPKIDLIESHQNSILFDFAREFSSKNLVQKLPVQAAVQIFEKNQPLPLEDSDNSTSYDQFSSDSSNLLHRRLIEDVRSSRGSICIGKAPLFVVVSLIALLTCSIMTLITLLCCMRRKRLLLPGRSEPPVPMWGTTTTISGATQISGTIQPTVGRPCYVAQLCQNSSSDSASNCVTDSTNSGSLSRDCDSPIGFNHGSSVLSAMDLGRSSRVRSSSVTRWHAGNGGSTFSSKPGTLGTRGCGVRNIGNASSSIRSRHFAAAVPEQLTATTEFHQQQLVPDALRHGRDPNPLCRSQQNGNRLRMSMDQSYRSRDQLLLRSAELVRKNQYPIFPVPDCSRTSGHFAARAQQQPIIAGGFRPSSRRDSFLHPAQQEPVSVAHRRSGSANFPRNRSLQR